MHMCEPFSISNKNQNTFLFHDANILKCQHAKVSPKQKSKKNILLIVKSGKSVSEY